MRSLTVNRSRIPPTVEDSVSFVLSRMLSVVAMWMLTPHLAQAGSGLYVSSEFGVNFTPNLDITGTNSVPAVTNNSTITVPGAPTRLIAAANGQTIINLYWTTPVSNGGSPITGYRIEISPVFNWTTLVADTTSTSTTYSHTGLAAGTTRYYRVSAINANGTGEPSNTAKITTGAPVPGAPTDLSATASGTTQIDLSWTAPDDGGSPIITYGIHVSPDGRTDWRTRAGNPNTTYSQIQLAPGTTRYYRVSAANAHGHSPFSNIASATTDTTGTGTSVPGGGGGGPRQTVPDAPTNVAFLEQAAPNTGESEDGNVQFHEGFSEEGAILGAFPNADFTMEDYEIVRITITEKPATSVEVLVTISNLAPSEGTHLTPFWVGFHDGSFNLFDEGAAASPGLESTAEDGATALLSAEFSNAALGFEDATITGPGPPPVFFPGNTSAFKFSLDSSSPLNRYFSFASMVIPSNDAFIGNGDPMAYEVFDESGNFVMTEIIILGTQVWDAGTEVNDEVPANVAFLEQAAPNTGPDENGTVQFHSGFASGGAILTAFPNADFTAGGYQVARISLSSSLLLEGSALFVNDGTSFQGNIYDGFELNGAEATFSSFPGEITRVAFLDPDGDLVFVEFGSDDPNTTLTISLQDFAASVPSPYNQPGKTYVQGLATITIENSTAGTYLSVFTLGNDPDRVDTAIISGSTFSGNVDGIADIKSISVESPDGQVTMIGGINAANANFVGLPGVLQFIGINAPDVIVANFLLIGDLTPVGRAAPRIIIDPSSTIQEISVTGGDLREAVGSLRVDTDDGVYPFSFTASSGQRSISDSSLRPDLGDGRLDAATDTFASDVDSYFLTGGQSSGVGQ